MVKIIIWNVQGALGADFNRYFRLFVHLHKPDIFAVIEPRISGAKADSFIRRSGFQASYRVEASGFSGGIWVLWNHSLSVDVVAISSQFVHSFISIPGINKSFFFMFVYASPTPAFRSTLWNQLLALIPDTNWSWALGGDFNVIADCSERSGGSQRRLGVCRLFKDFLFSSCLMDMGFHGSIYTWQRGDLLQRLDRFLCSPNWYDHFPNSEVVHLQRLGSDHCPILLNIDRNMPHLSSRPYRFISAWNLHPQFHEFLSGVWNEEMSLKDNILAFQKESNDWNANVFGHIGKRKAFLLARIRGIERVLSRNESFSLEFGERIKK
ncbi:hypothetical protein HRI_003847800 [Hibiscus trionum]|uniref:Endonuclease/exonuclease/phosphatase domain-containing protein n=1 Tax=Hibiscus trionum TaxID=183268 RepID=A0A9W7IUD3_HIBTR|nr:hypothetical protein HRI_003847800 [Hibiscus trionum]